MSASSVRTASRSFSHESSMLIRQSCVRSCCSKRYICSVYAFSAPEVPIHTKVSFRGVVIFALIFNCLSLRWLYGWNTVFLTVPALLFRLWSPISQSQAMCHYGENCSAWGSWCSIRNNLQSVHAITWKSQSNSSIRFCSELFVSNVTPEENDDEAHCEFEKLFTSLFLSRMAWHTVHDCTLCVVCVFTSFLVVYGVLTVFRFCRFFTRSFPISVE